MKSLYNKLVESLLDNEENIVNKEGYSIKLQSLFNKIKKLNEDDPWNNKGLGTYEKESELFIEIKKILRENSSIYNLKTPKDGRLYFKTYFGGGYEHFDIYFWSKPNCLKTYYGLSRSICLDARSWKNQTNAIQFKNFIEESVYPRPDKSAEYEVRVLNTDIANVLIKLLNSY